jgi:cytochrome c-type biogenesis protein CcmE
VRGVGNTGILSGVYRFREAAIMSQKAKKISATVVVLATAFGVLLYSSLGESLQQYKYVDEVMAAPQQWEGKRLKVHGYVVPKSIGRKDGTVQYRYEYRFDVERNGKTLRAFYTGTPPDQFKDEAEVVLTGVLKNNEFHATEMTAKCPSKYEERAPTEVGL